MKKLNEEDIYFIGSALNAFWHLAVTSLERNDLGDIERQTYEHQERRAKEIMGKIDRI